MRLAFAALALIVALAPLAARSRAAEGELSPPVERDVEPTPGPACNLSALSATEGRRRVRLEERLHRIRTDVRELPDGFEVELPATASVLRDAAEVMALEHACCPFLDMSLRVEPRGAKAWLRVAGGPGVKEMLREAFGQGGAVSPTKVVPRAPNAPRLRRSD